MLSGYRELEDDIRRWWETINTNDGGTTEYMSLYADRLSDSALLRLKNSQGPIAHALLMARETSSPASLMHGYRRDLNRRSWMALNHEHWGVIVKPEAKTRYVGFLKGGLPHGVGTMTYINGLSYSGDWLLGKRDRNGMLYRDGRLIAEGPFIDDKPAQSRESIQSVSMEEMLDARHIIPVEVTVIRGGDSVASAIFSVRAGPEPHRQVEKIARAFGWKAGERYRLTPALEVDNSVPNVPTGSLKSEFSIVANGSAIESGPYPDEAFAWSWPNRSGDLEWGAGHDSVVEPQVLSFSGADLVESVKDCEAEYSESAVSAYQD
ncbi:hypothetical protein ACJ41O_006417 [Fusarium nematophilum]